MITVITEIISYLWEFITGYLLADFLTGIYHWIKDTYFSPFTPCIGKLYIWNSRLHHIKPRYVTQFSDSELFVSSAKWTLLWMLPMFYLFGLNLFGITLFLTIAINDIVHKYAHLTEHERPKWATFLQKIGLFQSYEEHHLHHVKPYEINYCPITPYVNIVLEKINFWRQSEKLIETIFGIKARAIDYSYIEDPNYPANIKFLPDAYDA